MKACDVTETLLFKLSSKIFLNPRGIDVFKQKGKVVNNHVSITSGLAPITIGSTLRPSAFTKNFSVM